MKSPIFRSATSPGIKKPNLLVADSVELLADPGKVQTTGAGRKIDHTNLPVEVNAFFYIRREKCDFSYSYQRKSIHFNFPMERDGNTGKDFPRVRDRDGKALAPGKSILPPRVSISRRSKLELRDEFFSCQRGRL